MLALLISCLVACTSERFESLSIEQKLENLLSEHADAGRFSGVVLVARGEEILFEKGYGFTRVGGPVPDTASTCFEIASTSKLITRVAALLEHDEGRLSVEDRIERFLPGYPRGDEISVAHLIHNTSGIPDLHNLPRFSNAENFAGPISVDGIIALFRDLPLEYEPGTRIGYSSPGYMLLARIVETSSGLSFEDYLARRIFEPMGMTTAGHLDDDGTPEIATGYMRDGGSLTPAARFDRSFLFGAGGVYCSARDLYRFCESLSDGEFLSADALRQFTSLSHYGHNFGFRSGLVTIPSEGIAIIVLSNIDDAPVQEMVPEIIAILLDGMVIERDPADYAAYLGRYEAERFDEVDAVIQVSVIESRPTLRIDYSSGDPIELTLRSGSGDRFFALNDGAFTQLVVDFVRDEAGAVDRLVLDLSGWLIEASRTKD